MSARRQSLVFVLCVFLWTWGLAALMVLAPEWVESTFGELSGSHPLFILAVYAPSALGLLLTGVYEGRQGLVRLLARFDPRRFAPRWLLLMPLIFCAVALVGGLAASALVGAPFPAFAGWSALAAALTVALITEPGPLGEEIGWRGFLLPRFLDLWSPARASWILGAIWAVWHLPAFFISGLPQNALALPVFLVGAVALCILMTWLFLVTNGSLLIAVLAHRLANSSNDLVGSSFESFALALVVLAAVLLTRRTMRDRAPSTARWREGDASGKAAEA